MRDVVIVGAGAMGCLFGARLSESGANVTLVDVDETRLAALRRDGVTLRDDRGERNVPVRADLAACTAGPADLVMLFTKGMHSAAAIRSVAHFAGPGTVALTLQNGLGNAETIAQVFAPEHVLIGMTDFPADLEGPTHIVSRGEGHVLLGGYVPAAEAAAGPVAELFNRAGLSARVDPDVRVAVWEKVAFNAALNAMAAVTGLDVGGLDRPSGRRIAAAVAGEVVVVAAAQGLGLDRGRIESRIDFALRHHREHKPSMLQDRLAGRPTEVDSINGAVVRLAESAGVAAPVTALLADLVRLVEKQD
ncbi:MAG: ketopantoate reductase family protein [Allosphingosinicella sp.]